ncbi:MAG: hypothetical protein M1834_007085 [Cirrosporium novae-zelandiae]|nr:MAG: hypothetical protein M1834_007085 [Cirrosporium novae-zelandiae]
MKVPLKPHHREASKGPEQEDPEAEGYEEGLATRHLKYLDTCKELPVDAPVGHPHLIDCTHFNERVQRANLRLADAVATVLYNWRPEALCMFFDFTQPSFEWMRKEEDDTVMHTMILRKGRKVLVGLFREIEMGMDEMLEFDLQVRLEIDDSGAWIPEYAIMYGISRFDWGWPELANWDKPEYDPREAKFVKYCERQLATTMLVWRKWEKRDGAKMKVKVQ